MNESSYRIAPATDDNAALPLTSLPHPAEQTLLRVYTLGPLTLEWVGTTTPFPPERLVSRGAAPALLLLKALISRPHRYAARDWLCEHLHSAEEEALSPGRLDDLASLLRGLLCPPIEDRESRDRLRRALLSYVHSASESGPGYRLGSYPLIWVDIDALAWYVEQACRLERFGEEALPLWERAYALAKRGAYLIDEPYSDWAEPRRAEAARYLRQSVHALARLYLSQPDARAEEEALRLLGDYWQRHVEDEDALRPLMELLGRHERYQEALSYYARLCEVLEEEGRTPDARTIDLKEFLRTKQLQRSRAPQTSESAGNGRALPQLSQTDLLPLFSQAVTQGILQAVGELEGVRPLHLSDPITRRTVIAHFLGLSPALLLDWRSLSQLSNINLTNEDPFALYEDILHIGRGCLNNGGSPGTQRIDACINNLSLLVRDAPERDKGQWQSLLCRFYQLSSSLAHKHVLHQAHALSAITNAIDVARELDDAESIACCFFRRGRIYVDYSRMTQDETQKHRYLAHAKADVEAALDYAERVPTPLKGNIYLIAAEVTVPYAKSDTSLSLQCERWIDVVANLIAQGDVEDERTFLYLNRTGFHHEKAKLLLQFGRLQEARSELAQAWKTVQPNPLIWHGDIHLTEANLYKAEGDLEGSARSGMAAYTIARALQSQKIAAGVKRLLSQLELLDKSNAHIRQLSIMLEMG